MSTDLEGVLLDSRLDGLANDLCRRIATNPGLRLDEEPPGLRAILAGRILFLLKVAIENEHKPYFSVPVDRPRAAVERVFQTLAQTSLPPQWNGSDVGGILPDFRSMRRPT